MGLCRVISLELPQLWGGLVDLPNNATVSQAELLLASLLTTDGEDQQALRRGARYVARLVRIEGIRETKPLVISNQATYLLTGGLGALGLHAANYLARPGAKHLVLTSRRSPDETAQKAIHHIQQSTGCCIHVFQADVSLIEEVKVLFQHIADHLPPLRGIIHAAGVVGLEHLLARFPPTTLTMSQRPKWRGTWNLQQQQSQAQLDFVIYFSSIASAWGSLGQAHYAAANAFLDGFAHFQRGKWMSAR